MKIDKSVVERLNVLCFDLDGTILDDKKTISEFTSDTLRKLQKAGCEIIIATGRSVEKAEEFLSEFDFPYRILGNNGAISLNHESHRADFILPIKREYFESIRKMGIEEGILPYLYIYDPNGKYNLVIEDGLEKRDFLGSVKDVSEILYLSQAEEYLHNILSVVFLEPVDKINKICARVFELDMDITSHTIYAFSEGSLMTEFLNSEATKGKGIDKVLKSIGKTWENVISFGDDNNDESMIVFSELGISMINGSKNLKEHASHITEFDNNNNGVARELIKIYGGNYEKP